MGLRPTQASTQAMLSKGDRPAARVRWKFMGLGGMAQPLRPPWDPRIEGGQSPPSMPTPRKVKLSQAAEGVPMAHHYPFALAWTGNTLDGAYNRNATVTHPGKPALSVSSAPEYAGDATRWNPEDLLGAALSTPMAAVPHPGKPALPVSSAPEYAGDATRWNPEDLLGAALSTCHMLTFLALCSKARVEIRGYEDHAEAILDTVDKVARVTQVYLRPVISVGHGTHQDKVLELF